MKNITLLVEIPAYIAIWILASLVIPSVFGNPTIALVGGLLLALTLIPLVMKFFEGERIWVGRTSEFPYVEVVIKPRGFYHFKMNSSRPGGEQLTKCSGCGEGFDDFNDHLSSDRKNYCEACSNIGEYVMTNYRDWYETAEEVTERN